MNIFTESFRAKAELAVIKYIEAAESHDYDDILSFIKTHRKSWIVELMQDDPECNWEEIILSKMKVKDVKKAYSGIIRNGRGNYNAFDIIVKEILFYYFCNEIIDIDHEINAWLKAEEEADPSQTEQDKQNLYDFNHMQGIH